MCLFFFFFFQAEDGIRDVAVTGVQTCALPICVLWPADRDRDRCAALRTDATARRSARDQGDRKSTRLNSSHGYISYAVFCLKKKKKTVEGRPYVAHTRNQPGDQRSSQHYRRFT